MKQTSEINLIEDNRGAAALLDPLRAQILGLLEQPNSAAGLARRLRIPRQRINYHLRELEKHRLVEEVEERRKGNCIERIVRATARAYVISPQAVGALSADPDQIQDRFSSTYLVAVAARAIQELGYLRSKAAEAGKNLATLTLQADVRFATAQTRHAFADELAAEIAKLIAKYNDEKSRNGRRFRFFVCAYPAITKSKGRKKT